MTDPADLGASRRAGAGCDLLTIEETAAVLRVSVRRVQAAVEKMIAQRGGGARG